MTITEVKRSGGGVLEETQTVFKFTGQDHSSPIGDLQLHLMVKTSRKEMPGSNEVVEHAMAATWQPFELTGEWRDMWGNRNTTNGFSRTGPFAWFMVEEFAKFVSRMPLVRFELDAFRFICLITDFHIRYQTKSKIGWTMKLSPHINEVMEGTRAPRRTIAQPIAKWIQDLADQSTTMNDNYKRVQFIPLKTTRLEDFAIKLAELNAGMDRLQSIGADDLTFGTTNKLLLLATTFRRLRNANIQIALALSRVTSPLDVAFTDVLKMAQYTEWNMGTQTLAWQMVGASSRAEIDALSRARQKPKAIYYPKRGESLERIARRFYGSANSWRIIYDRNNLSSLTLDGTEELIIPESAA